MKIKYLIYSLSILFLASCGNDYDLDENFNLQELPGYVAFDADGNNATLDDVAVDENAGSASLTVECPTGTLSDITVTYALSGNAVWGVDYTIDGADASGGSIVLDHNAADFENRDEVDIVVNVLTDGVFDATKEVIITLTGASNSEGSLAVGRGGLNFLNEAKVIISNVDCGFEDISTDYTFESSNFSMPNGSCDGTQTTSGSGSISALNADFSSFTFDDWSFGSYPECYGGLPPDWGTLSLDFCSNVVVVSGADTYGDGWEWTSVSASGAQLSISWVNAFGENGSTVLTKTDGTDWNPLSL